MPVLLPAILVAFVVLGLLVLRRSTGHRALPGPRVGRTIGGVTAFVFVVFGWLSLIYLILIAGVALADLALWLGYRYDRRRLERFRAHTGESTFTP